VTIRAFGWSHAYFLKTLDLINAAQQPYYLLLCIQRWLVCVLDLIVAGMTILLVALAVVLRSKLDAGLLGLALIMMMTLGKAMAELVQYWTQLETSLGAVARIKRFSETTPSELLLAERSDPGETWPKEGMLKFSDVSLSYK
jgi:ATP-binding cassette, subfamily C (CFTR/MRP), member 1